jgi:glucose-1-phosphate adenylyltransferase
MIAYHRHKKADITIGMMVVPKSEIHQFGAGIVDDENRIIDWEEKPKEPKTNLASMGIYIFDTAYLLDTLSRDRTENDFGMHIIPRAIKEDRVFAYPFYGYWRDVGTIQSYWEANMDIIRPDSGISPEEWGIRPNTEADGRPMDRAPARFISGCTVHCSMISAGCIIEGTVERSVVSPGVVVKKGAVVRDSVIFEDCVIDEDARVDLVICDKGVLIGRGAVVGYGDNKEIPNQEFPSHLYTGITLVGKKATVPAGMKIGRNCIVNSGYNGGEGLSTEKLEDGGIL